MPRTDPMDLIYGFEGQGQEALTNLLGLKSGYEGVSTAGDVRKRFGATDTSAVYAPLYKRLATQKAQGLKGAAVRAGRSASPEMTFSNVEEGYGQNLQSLLGQQGQADIQQNQFIAQLLNSILGQQGQFGLQKNQAAGALSGNMFQNRLGLEQFNQANKGPSFFDYFSTILGAASKPAAAMLSPSPTK